MGAVSTYVGEAGMKSAALRARSDGMRTCVLFLWALLSVCVLPLRAQTVEYVHTDALGTPVAITNAAGQVIEQSEYEPYGKLLNRPLTDGPGFTGHVQDATTGLTYMQQRYYDAQVGRFLSVDPVDALSNPIGMFNRYRYAANNPYKFTDPDGRCYTSTGKCMTPEEFDKAWEGEGSRVLNAIGSPLGTLADMLSGDFKGVMVGIALSRVPGGKQSSEAAGFFIRFGKKSETVENLGEQAAKDEKAGFPHGVSVKAQDKVSAADRASHRVADQKTTRDTFNVKQTGKDPKHHTVELPKPVTESAAKKFNETFK